MAESVAVVVRWTWPGRLFMLAEILTVVAIVMSAVTPSVPLPVVVAGRVSFLSLVEWFC